MKNFSFVEVAEEDAERVVKGLKHGVTVKGRSVVADFADKNENTSAKNKAKAEKPGKKYSKKEKEHTMPPKKKYSKEDWMAFLHPEHNKTHQNEEEGWARRKPKKK